MYEWRKHNQVKRKQENVYVLVQFIFKTFVCDDNFNAPC